MRKPVHFVFQAVVGSLVIGALSLGCPAGAAQTTPAPVATAAPSTPYLMPSPGTEICVISDEAGDVVTGSGGSGAPTPDTGPGSEASVQSAIIQSLSFGYGFTAVDSTSTDCATGTTKDVVYLHWHFYQPATDRYSEDSYFGTRNADISLSWGLLDKNGVHVPVLRPDSPTLPRETGKAPARKSFATVPLSLIAAVIGVLSIVNLNRKPIVSTGTGTSITSVGGAVNSVLQPINSVNKMVS